MDNPPGETLEDTFERRFELARWYFYAGGLVTGAKEPP